MSQGLHAAALRVQASIAGFQGTADAMSIRTSMPGAMMTFVVVSTSSLHKIRMAMRMGQGYLSRKRHSTRGISSRERPMSRSTCRPGSGTGPLPSAAASGRAAYEQFASADRGRRLL